MPVDSWMIKLINQDVLFVILGFWSHSASDLWKFRKRWHWSISLCCFWRVVSILVFIDSDVFIFWIKSFWTWFCFWTINQGFSRQNLLFMLLDNRTWSQKFLYLLLSSNVRIWLMSSQRRKETICILCWISMRFIKFIQRSLSFLWILRRGCWSFNITRKMFFFNFNRRIIRI